MGYSLQLPELLLSRPENNLHVTRPRGYLLFTGKKVQTKSALGFWARQSSKPDRHYHREAY